MFVRIVGVSASQPQIPDLDGVYRFIIMHGPQIELRTTQRQPAGHDQEQDQANPPVH